MVNTFRLVWLATFAIVLIQNCSEYRTKYVDARPCLLIRQAPSLNAAWGNCMPYGSRVTIIRTLDKQEIIQGAAGQWALVASEFGTGWAFGGFLTENPLIPVVADIESSVQKALAALLNLVAIALVVAVVLGLVLFKRFLETSPSPTNRVQSLLNRYSSPQDPFRKGQQFEEYIAQIFDKNTAFAIQEWQRSERVTVKVESHRNPDLLLRHIPSNTLFAVECKFRSGLHWEASLNQRVVQFVKQVHFDNYVRFSRNSGVQVYIVLGLGGVPNNPDRIFLFRLETVLNRHYLLPEELTQFEHPKGQFTWSADGLS